MPNIMTAPILSAQARWFNRSMHHKNPNTISDMSDSYQ